VAVKFTEWIYCNHTCILKVYWEGSPLKCSTWPAVHLVQQCCHSWKHLGLLLWSSFQCHCHTFWDVFSILRSLPL
jgi:hypothetical protein